MYVDPDSRMSLSFGEIDISDKNHSASVEMKRKAERFAQVTYQKSHFVVFLFLLFLESLLVSHHRNHLNHVCAVTLCSCHVCFYPHVDEVRVCLCVYVLVCFLYGSHVG